MYALLVCIGAFHFAGIFTEPELISGIMDAVLVLGCIIGISILYKHPEFKDD
jgi:hypothetical protein